MPQVKMLDGRALEVPIEELITFFEQHADEIQLQNEKKGEHDIPPDPSAFPFSETVGLSH